MAGSKNPEPTSCPTRQQLQALLKLNTSDAFSASLRDHLELCRTCQATLDELTAAPELATMREYWDDSTSLPDLSNAKLLIQQQLHSPGPSSIAGRELSRPLQNVEQNKAGDHLLPPRDARTAKTIAASLSLETVEDNQSILESENSIPNRIGTYDVLGVLGKGGMGTVYLGFDSRVNRKVAIKTVKDQREELRGRLAREAEAIGRFSNPHVVQLYAFEEVVIGGQSDQVCFSLVMEFIDGESLAQRIAGTTNISFQQAAAIALAAADGVQAAHECGVLHRDIKPK